MTVIINEPNPDKSAILNKEQISIPVSFSEIQVALSGSSGNPELLDKVVLSESEQRMRLSIAAVEVENQFFTQDGLTGVYYTPLYAEKINYTEWRRRINKTFNELEVGE